MSALSRGLRRLVPLLVLAAGGAAAWWLIATAPGQDKATPEPIVPRVAVQAVAAVTRPVSVEAFGEVMPAREVELTPEVRGRVIEQHPALEPGGLVKQGEVLLRLDPSDYEIALAAAEARLAQAEADLEVERGRGTVAKREWERFADSLETVSEDQRSAALALREPQLQRAEAVLAAARNDVADARLQLSRTSLRAPFDGVVRAEAVEIGRRLEPGAFAVRLAGVASFWITGSVPLGRAERLPLEGDGDAAPVTVTLETGVDRAVTRTGRFVRRLPDLEAQGRMARVLVAVDDPLALADPDLPALPIGSYVRMDLPAGELADVIEAPREALRENRQVWVRDADGRLRYRDVDVLWRGADTVLLRGDFEPGDALVTSYLSDPLPGIALDVRDDAASAADGTDDARPGTP